MVSVDKIIEILYEADIMGLASFGVPLDEYRPEAETIYLLYRVYGKELKADQIKYIFWLYFGIPNNKSSRDHIYQQIVDKILEL